jgi:hypothetical protein
VLFQEDTVPFQIVDLLEGVDRPEGGLTEPAVVDAGSEAGFAEFNLQSLYPRTAVARRESRRNLPRFTRSEQVRVIGVYFERRDGNENAQHEDGADDRR